MPARKLVDNTLRNLIEHVPTALTQATQFPDQAGQIIEAFRATQRDIRHLDHSDCDRLVEAALAASVGPELRRYVARESDAMKNPSFVSAIVNDAAVDSESLQFLRDFKLDASEEQLRTMLKSPSIPVREFGARLAIHHRRFLAIAAATLMHDGNAEVIRQLAGASIPRSPLREAHALAEILFARPCTSSEAAKALEAVGSTPSWLSNEALDPALGPLWISPYGNVAPILNSIDRVRMTLLTLIDAVRPDLAVPILMGWRPALLLGNDVERLRSAPDFVGRLAQTRPDVPGHILAELCALFGSRVVQFRSLSRDTEENAANLLPGFLLDVLSNMSSAIAPFWVTLRQTSVYAGLAEVQKSFLESAPASVGMKLASLEQRPQTVEAFRAWFETGARAEHWDGLVAVLAVQYGGLPVEAVWPRVTTETAALIAAAAWEADLSTPLMPRPDLPGILVRIALSRASASVRAQALAGARRCSVQPPLIDDLDVLTLALMRSIENGRCPADTWPYVVELFEHSDDELLSARPWISRVGAAALDTAAEAGETAGPAGVERLARLCFKILAAKIDPSHGYHDGALWLSTRMWQEDEVRRRQLVDTLSKLGPDEVDSFLARMPERLVEQLARSGSTPPRIRARALLYALNSSAFDPKRCDVSGDPEALARACEGFKSFDSSNFKATAEYLIRACINAFVRHLPSLAEMEEQSSPWFRLRESLRELLIAYPKLSTFASEHLAERLSGVLREFVNNRTSQRSTTDASCWIRAAGKLKDPRPMSVVRMHASALKNAGLPAAIEEAVSNDPRETLAANVRVILALRELRKD